MVKRKIVKMWVPESFKQMVWEEKAVNTDKSLIDILDEMAENKKRRKNGFGFPRF